MDETTILLITDTIDSINKKAEEINIDGTIHLSDLKNIVQEIADKVAIILDSE